MNTIFSNKELESLFLTFHHCHDSANIAEESAGYSDESVRYYVPAKEKLKFLPLNKLIFAGSQLFLLSRTQDKEGIELLKESYILSCLCDLDYQIAKKQAEDIFDSDVKISQEDTSKLQKLTMMANHIFKNTLIGNELENKNKFLANFCEK